MDPGAGIEPSIYRSLINQVVHCCQLYGGVPEAEAEVVTEPGNDIRKTRRRAALTGSPVLVWVVRWHGGDEQRSKHCLTVKIADNVGAPSA